MILPRLVWALICLAALVVTGLMLTRPSDGVLMAMTAVVLAAGAATLWMLRRSRAEKR